MPGDTGNRLRQFVISHHVFDPQILDADRLVFTDQVGGEFLKEISSLVCDFLMNLGNADTLLIEVVRSRLLSGETTLRTAESLLRLF